MRTRDEWYEWVRRMLLLVGSALVLSGIIFFFAYNWAEMNRFVKLGMVQAGIAGCVAGAYYVRLDRLPGKILLMSSSVLVGVLLAVYGQIYQTGADAYELFAGWAVLIAGWVVISRFAGLWLLWLAVVNTTAILFWGQVAEPAYDIPYATLCMFLGVVNGAALIGREAGLDAGREWLKGAWLRGVLLCAMLIPLTIPTLHAIIDMDDAGGVTAVAAVVWLIAAVSSFMSFRFKLRDMPSIAMVVMNGCVVSLTLIGKLIFHNTDFDNAGAYLAMALVVLGTVSAAAFWLKRIGARMAAETGGGEA